MGKWYCMKWFKCFIFSTLLTLESVLDLFQPVKYRISSSFLLCCQKLKRFLKEVNTIFKKRHIPRTVFNSKKDLDTVLYKNSFQGYRQFISVYSLSHNSPNTLKRWPGFQIFPSNFYQITPTQSTEPILAPLGNPTKGALGLRKTQNILSLTCLTDS